MSIIPVLGMSVDAGGSEARVLPVQRGAVNPSNIIKIPSNFQTVEESTFRIRECDSPNLFIDVLQAPYQEYKGMMAAGAPAAVYTGTNLLMNSIDFKTECVEYYKEIIFAVAQNVLAETKSAANVGCVNITLAINIPVREYHSSTNQTEVLKDKLNGKYCVSFPLLPNTPTVTFNILRDYIGVLPEGGVIVSSINPAPKEKEITLIDDLGHISNDISLFEGKKIRGKTKLAGNSAGSMLISMIKGELTDHKFNVTDNDVKSAIKTGMVMVGSKSTDVSDIIRKVKESYVINSVKPDYLELFGIERIYPTSIQRFAPIGELMNSNPRTGSISEMIIKAVGLDNAEIVTICDDLRYTNITALNKFAVKKLDSYLKA